MRPDIEPRRIIKEPTVKGEPTLYGIRVLPLPLSELPIISPDVESMPKPQDYPWEGVKVTLQEQADATVQKAADVAQTPLDTLKLPIQEPANMKRGDFAVAVFSLAKPLGIRPQEIASTIADNFNNGEGVPLIDGAVAEGGYVNFRLETQAFGRAVLSDIEEKGERYGEQNIGNGDTIVIDCSSPNVAKHMSVGHLRSTIIGESLSRIYKATGYEVIRDNHLGDWGTQFGMLGRAYELWGDEIEGADSVQGLYHLYVKIHDEIEKEKAAIEPSITATRHEKNLRNFLSMEIDEEQAATAPQPDERVETSLEKEGRAWFKRLEEGDPEALDLLHRATTMSLGEFKRVYELLGTGYEYNLGESYFVPMIPDVVRALQDRGIASSDERGALTVNFPEGEKLRRLVVQKSDGTSLYATRDLATLVARTSWFEPQKIVYVVGGDQKEYFKQVFAAFDLLSDGEGPETEHISFGMISLPEGKMSTRKGRVVFLEDVLTDAIAKAKEKIVETNKDLTPDEIDRIAQQVGVGAIVYTDLGQGRERNIKFDIDQALSLEGNSAPYIQYAHARAKSILRKAEEQGITTTVEEEPTFELEVEQELVRQLATYPEAVREALASSQPSKVADYTHKTAQLFSQFYRETRILTEQDKAKQATQLRLTAATAQVIANGLRLLCIEAPDKM